MKAYAVVYLNDYADFFEVLAVFTDYDNAVEFAKGKGFSDPEYAIYETTLNPEMT